MDMVANVLFDDPAPDIENAIADEVPRFRRDGDMVWFDCDGYLAVWDEDDPLSAPLFVMYASADAMAATVLAPDCADPSELARRVYRDLSGSFTIDDSDEAVPPCAGASGGGDPLPNN